MDKGNVKIASVMANRFYICKTCNASVIAGEDMLDHVHKTGHHEFIKNWSSDIVLCVG